jgi:hypothetical protein
VFPVERDSDACLPWARPSVQHKECLCLQVSFTLHIAHLKTITPFLCTREEESSPPRVTPLTGPQFPH